MSLWYVFTYRLNLAGTDMGNYPPTPPLKHNFTRKWELNVRVCCKRDLIFNFSSNCRSSWLNVYIEYRTGGKYYLGTGKRVLGLHKSEVGGRGGGGWKLWKVMPYPWRATILPTPRGQYVRLWKHNRSQWKVFFCFYKVTFPKRKEEAKLLVARKKRLLKEKLPLAAMCCSLLT